MAVGEKGLGAIPLHYQSALGQLVDIGMARWREWQLIAVRWAFNVIPDELFRLSASGFASPAYHPGQYLMYAFGSKGDIALNGDRFSDTLIASELGAGYAQNLTEVAQRGFVGDVRRVPWIPIQEGTQGYFDAWGTQIIHMWADKFTRKALSMTREDALFYFQNDPSGIAIVDDILKGARADTRLSKLTDEAILRDHIAQVDARAHQMAGGTWRAYDVDPQNPGKWTDSNGNVWDQPPPKWVKGDDNWVITQKGDEDILSIMATGRVKTTYVDKAGDTQTGTKSILWSDKGPAGDIFATESKSRRQGMAQVERLRDQLKSSRAKWKRSEEAGTVAPAAPKWVRGQDPRLAKRLDGSYKMFVDQAFSILGQAPTMLLARSPHFKQVYWREMARGYVNSTPELRKIIKSRAKQAGMELDVEKWIREELVLAGYSVPRGLPKGANAAIPQPTAGMKPAQWNDLSDDDLIEVYHVTTRAQADEFLKSGVSAKAKVAPKDQPHVAETFEPFYVGEGLYVGSNPEKLSEYYGRNAAGQIGEGNVTLAVTVRRGDLGLGPEAAKAGQRSVSKELGDPRIGSLVKGDIPANRVREIASGGGAHAPGPKITVAPIKRTTAVGGDGLPVMPKGAGWDDMDELNEWGKAVGLDETKSLLYDLSESHNIVDMTRNVFVFAEAWWEILSRWSNMLFNPQTRSLYNWEKARQIGEFAQQEGWMSENEFGQTVWNYPSLGLTALGQQGRGQTPERLASEISTQQLISNPLAQLGGGEQGALRSVMGPGFGPITQILAVPFSSALPNSWQNMFQYGVTGEFPLADSLLAQGFHSLPSSYKNALTLINAEFGMTERRFSTNVSTALEMLAVSGEYDMADPDAHLALEKDANSLGRTLTLSRLIDSLFAPESPRYVPQILEDSIRFDQHQYIDAAAIGAAIDYATELFRDPLAASAYVADQYGLDPMNLEGVDLPRSRVIKQRPVTFAAFTVAKDNSEFYDKYPFTAYAFAPDNPDEDFFSRAWTDQLSNDTTVSLTTEQQVAVFSNRQGTKKFKWSQTYAEQQMNIQVKQNPHRRKGIEQDWRDWLQARTLDIQAEHTGWSRSVFDINAHYTPGPATPEWGDLYDDFKRMVVRDSEGIIIGATDDVMAMDPITAEFVRGFMSGIDEASADSVVRGNSEISWLASTAGWATAWQNKIAEDSRTYVNAVRAEGGSTTGVEWIIRRWLDPLLKGTDMDTPFITDSGVGIAPVYRADDRITVNE